MAAHDAARRRQNARIGGLTSWANTADRAARTLNGRQAGPSCIEWHVARLDPARFADATDEQRLAAADVARRAYYARLAYKSHQTRSRNRRDAA